MVPSVPSAPFFMSQLGTHLWRASNGSLLSPSSPCSGCGRTLLRLLD